ncbi:hypothetical protein BSL82_04400 [Tardibacter chloracetimidivorans]|uniref:AMP-dependent synthetase n=1 Tax=Tardibacter chloracetimidivorans TaxID=1921510 RepID=A0A1L3ZSP5_9SPHN|nr:AMP-binding protein [Tardibacter chloracetimidivorans]API58645.1 hypothetical protein BSL82_04400 [Tardibacter chloracetimidivorans]
MRKAAAIAPGETIGDIFDHNAQHAAGFDAIVNDAQSIDYGSLAAMVDCMAAFLVGKGIGKGDRVAILSNARAEVVITFLACAKIGAIYLGLSTRLAQPELAYIMDDAKPGFIFSADILDGKDYGQLVSAVSKDAAGPVPFIFSASGQALSPEFTRLVAGDAPPAKLPNDVTENDPVAIIYTSGSTGAPKGALLSHANLIISAKAYIEQSALRRPRAISQLPIDHVGYVLCEMAAILMVGGALVQVPRFDSELLLSAIERHRVTLVLCIPTMIQRLVESGLLDRYDLSSLEFLWWAGPLPTSSVAVMRRYCKVLAVSYGMTEASGTITFSTEKDGDLEICSTVGRPHPRVEVRIVRADGEDAPGEIQLKGPQIMLGYWNKPDATRAAFTEDGWFRTGDLGIFKGDNIAIVGRSKEMIRSGGYNILPSEVEIALEEHADVVMAFVGGVPDALYGEAVHAIVQVRDVAKTSGEGLSSFLKQRISSVKIPKQVYFRSSLPLLANGKIDRKTLREELVRLAEAGTPQ